MKLDYNLEALNLRKRAVERAAKAVALKLEKTLYLYNIEKEKRKSAAVKQLRVLLDYETRELERAKAELREIAVKMILLEQEKQKQAKTRMRGIAVLLIFSLAFAGLMAQYGLRDDVTQEFIDTSNAPSFSITDKFLAFLEKLDHYRSDNSLTGAIVGIPVGNCREERSCVNETITACKNETVQRCDSVCVNETIENCSEQCLPSCTVEEINGKEREVCAKECSDVCTEEVVENCGSCVDVVEEKCSAEVVEQCSTEIVCDELVESEVAAEIVEESPAVGIQPIVEEPVEESSGLEIMPPVEEVPSDDVTGGAITIPELEEPGLALPVEEEEVPEEEAELEVQPIIEEPVEEISPGEEEEEEIPAEEAELGVQPIIEEPIEEEPVEVPEEEIPSMEEIETPVEENLPPDVSEPETTEEPSAEEVVPPEEEEKSFFASMIESIKEALSPELHPLALSINYVRLNTTFVTSAVAANLTAHVNTTEGLSKITYNWFRNGTSITKLNVPFEKINSTTTNNSRDYSGYNYNMNPLGGVTWNATGGFDGKGAYTLRGTVTQNLSIYNMSFPTTALSVAFWFLSNGSGDGILSYAPSDPENNEFLLFEQTNLAVYTNGAAVTTGVSLSNKIWHHVVVTWRSSDGRIQVYKDGELNYSAATGSTAALNNTRRGCLVIGQDNDDYCGAYGATQALNGTVDELLIFDRVINADQVFALWSNQSNTIIDREVVKGEKWTVEATANDGSIDGAPKKDHYYIYQPVIHSLVLNSTNTSTNSSDVNITAYVVTADSDNDNVKVTYNWLVNNSPIAILNMPFEQVNFTDFNNSWDYSGFGNNWNESGGSGANWSATAGYDGKGAYGFNGLNNNNFITLSENGYWKNLCLSGCTFSAWVTVGEREIGPQLILSRGNAQSTFFEFSAPRTAGQGASLGVNFNGSISGNPSPRCSVSTTAGIAFNKGASQNHIVGVYNLSHIAIYINGTQKTLSACPIYGLNATIWQNNSRVLIGARDNAGSTSNNLNGTIDELMVFNRSLTEAQIRALWLNQTNIIVAQETGRAENWSVQAFPNDGFTDGEFADGTIALSENVSVLNQKPTLILVVNSTNMSSNNTHVNITAYATASDNDSDPTKVIYNWRVNGTPVMVLNMPFEQVNGTSTENAWDYSGLGNNGDNIFGGENWSATAGYDGKGAYQFDGIDDYINVSNADYFKGTLCMSGCTFAAWAKGVSKPGAPKIIARIQSTNNDRFFSFGFDSSGAANQKLGLVINPDGGPSVSCTANSADGQFLNNTYQHVVGVYNLTNTAVYINGTLVGTTACSFNNISLAQWADEEDTRIGADAIGNQWNGTIDEVMIWNRSLSAEQIRALWLNQTNIIVAQETNRFQNWTIEATPNDGYEDGIMQFNNISILNAKTILSTLVLNSTNITSNNTNVNLTAYSTTSDNDTDSVKVIYNWLLNGTPIAVLNMPFEGINSTTDNNAWDYSGLGNNGSDTSSPFWNASGGYDGKGAYMFDGFNDYIGFVDTASLNINGSLTLVAWLKPRTDATQQEIIWHGDGGIDWGLRRLSTGELRGIVANASNTQLSATSTADIIDNVWQHVVMVYNLDNENISLYINGVLNASTKTQDFGKLRDSGRFELGNFFPTNNTGFNGTIDEVMVFNRSLSLEQIQALYRNQTNIIVAQETNRFQNWTVQATPNDGLDDGVMLFNNISILNAKPVISPLILNSTNPKANHTGTHLLAYPNSSDADNDSIKVIYNWLRNDTPIALLNMPFEKINGTDTDNAWDYSGYGHNGSVVGATWNASGGYDGKGAYMFDDSGDYVELTAHLSRLEGLSAGTISLWYRSNDTTTNGDYLLSITDKDVSTDVMIFSVGASTGAYTDEGLNFVNIRGGATVLSMFVREGETAYKNQQWHHLAVVTGDGDNRMYINGVRKPITFGAGSATTKEFSNINNPDSSFIGRYHVGGTAFDSAGRRDDVLFFNRSLSEEQIVALYNNRTDKIVSRELRVGENWTIEATPNDGYEDGAMVTSKNVTILANTVPSISSLILNTTNTSSNKTEVNLTAYVGYTDSNNDSVKIIYNWLRDGTPMTFLNMPFERINDTNTNNAKDYSFNSNNGTPSGATWIEDAGYDSKGAYKFDGVNDYIASVGNVSDFTFMQNTGNFTIEAWIKFDDYTANSLQVIAGNTPTTAEKGFLFTYENRTGNLGHNHLTLALYRGVTGTYTVWANSSDFKIIDNNWHHVAAVGNYTNVLFYVDGVYDTGSVGEIINLPTGNANRVLDLGRYNGATPAGYFNGTIDELRIWNHTLPAEQIFAIFNNRTNIIVSNLTTAGENWTVDATPNDGVDDGATVRSNQVIISSGANTLPPAPVLLTPPTANITTNRTPAFTWNNSVDADGNTVTYRLEIDDNPAFNNLEVNVSDIANTTADNTTYLITTELAVDTTYFWKVFAYDGTEFGTNSTVFNFTLQSFLAIDIINNAVAFGTLNNGQNVSTPANANPFRAENSGNIVANVTLTATPLFGMVSLNQPFFAFNITANETGAFNYTQSSTNWTFFNSSSPFPHVWNLDWHLASNDFITHVNVSVPGNESGGLKSSIVTFTIQS